MHTFGKVAMLAVLPSLVVLGGCVTLDSSFVIGTDETLDVTMEVGIPEEFATRAGVGEDFCAALAGSLEGLPGNATQTPVKADGYVACRVAGRSTVAALAADSSLTITHADGEYAFAWAGAEDGSGMSAAMVSSLRVAVTFPGEVISHNGSSTVEDTTVTWTKPQDLFGSEGLRATGRDTAGLGMWPWVVGGAAVVALGVVAGAVALIRGRRQPAAPSAIAVQPQPYQPTAWQPGAPMESPPSMPQGFSPPQGYGPPPAHPFQQYQPPPQPAPDAWRPPSGS